MARAHTLNSRLFVADRHVSGDTISFNYSLSADTHDATTLADSWRTFDAGLLTAEASLEAFYDNTAIASGSITKSLFDAIGATTGITSLYFGLADAVGDQGILFPAGPWTSEAINVSHTDLVKISAQFKPSGKVGHKGRLLHVLAARTTTADGSSLDNSASSANGGRGTIHVTAITGAATVKIQHSTDNSVWADLITFTPSAIGATTAEVTGTVNRYLRATWAPGTTITFALGFARY